MVGANSGSDSHGGTTAVGVTAGNRECNPVARHIGRAIKSVRVERTLNTIGRTGKPPSRKGGEYRMSDVHASDPEDAYGRRRGEEAYATVAQRKERHPPEVSVAGSNPAGGTSGRMTFHGKPKSVGAFPPPWRMHGGVKRAPREEGEGRRGTPSGLPVRGANQGYGIKAAGAKPKLKPAAACPRSSGDRAPPS